MNSRTIPKKIITTLQFKARGRCCLCRKVIDPQAFNEDVYLSALEKHHIVYFSEGGDNTYENLVLLCADCHTLVHKYSEKFPIQRTKKGVTS